MNVVKVLTLFVILVYFGMTQTNAEEVAEVQQYQLRVTSSPNILFLSGGGLYDPGELVKLPKAPEMFLDYEFVGWQVDGKWSYENPLAITMNSAHNVEAIYTKSDLGGKVIVDSIPRITEIIVDGTIYLPNELPLSFSWVAGSTHTLNIKPFVQKDPQSRYKFDSWKDMDQGTLRTITVGESANDFIALYRIQHLLKSISERGNVEGDGWHEEGSSVTFGVESQTVLDENDPNIRYVFDSWSTGDYPNSPTNSLDLIQPTTAKANWKTQHFVTLTSNMPGYTPFGGGWVTEGGTYTLLAEGELESPTSDTKYVFNRWVATGSNPAIVSLPQSPLTDIVVTEPVSIEAQYQKSHLVNVFTPYGVALGSGYYDEGTTAQISIQGTQVDMEPNQIRKIFGGWDAQGARIIGGKQESANQNLMIYVDKPIDVTAQWKTQYYLNTKSPQSAVTGSGWYDAGTQVKISVKAPTEPASMWTAYTFDGWSGDYTGTSTSGKVIMDGPKTVVAEWVEDGTPGIINGIVLGGIALVGIVIFSKARKQEKIFSAGKFGIKNKLNANKFSKSLPYGKYPHSILDKIKNLVFRKTNRGNGRSFNRLFSKEGQFDSNPNLIFDEDEVKINSDFFRMRRSDT